MYGTGDPTTGEAVEHYQGLSARAKMTADFRLIEGANHSFYSLAWKAEVIEATLGWLGEHAGMLHIVPATPRR